MVPSDLAVLPHGPNGTVRAFARRVGRGKFDMATTVFDIGVRTLECKQCGAPIAAPGGGGHIQCTYCSATNVVTTRSSDGQGRSPLSTSAEIARLSRLNAQLVHPLGGHPYDMQRPPIGWSASAAATPQGLQRMTREWGMMKTAAASRLSPEEQRHLAWLSLHLAEAYHREHKTLQERAVLETALDLLNDPGHRHLVRCRLAKEAVRVEDWVSAEGWLSECDPAPEVVELDTAYRDALVHLRHGQKNWSAVLSVIGAQPGDIPIHPTSAWSLALLRVHALDALGQQQAADAQLTTLWQRTTIDGVLQTLEEQRLAPGAASRLRQVLHAKIRNEISSLAHRSASLPTGLRSIAGPLAVVPFFAALLWLMVTIPRCNCDVDPMLGAPGYVLCPRKCAECDGPWRIYTPWSHSGGESSTNGARYFCYPRSSGVDRMSREEWSSKWHEYQPYELDWAPAGVTFLILLGVALPIVPIGAVRIHLGARRRRKELEAKLASLAQSVGDEPPVLRSSLGIPAVLVSLAWVLITAILAMLLIAIEWL